LTSFLYLFPFSSNNNLDDDDSFRQEQQEEQEHKEEKNDDDSFHNDDSFREVQQEEQEHEEEEEEGFEDIFPDILKQLMTKMVMIGLRIMKKSHLSATGIVYLLVISMITITP
jgi:hypothetical protein